MTDSRTDIGLRNNGTDHGKGAESFFVQMCHVFRTDAADAGKGHVVLGQGVTDGFITDYIVGILFRLGRIHGPESDIVGPVGNGTFYFIDGIRGNADEDIRAGQSAHEGIGCIVLADVDAVSTTGDGQIDRVVHDEGDAGFMAHGRNLAGFCILFPPGFMLFPVLDHFDAGVDDLPGRFYISSAQAQGFTEDAINGFR